MIETPLKIMGAAPEPADIGGCFRESSPTQAFASLEARLAECPEAERGALRSAILDAAETWIRAADAVAPDWLEALFAASASYLRPGASAKSAATPSPLTARFLGLTESALAKISLEGRAAALRLAMAQTADPSLACLLLAGEEDQLAGLLGSTVAELHDLVRQQVEALAAERLLWQQALPAALLWFWWRFGEEDRAYAFVAASIDDPKALPVLLDIIVEPGSAGDLVAVRRWSKLVDFARLEKAALQLAMNSGVPAERRRARRFLEAFGNGKSELFR